MLNLKKSIVDDYWRKTSPRMSKVISIMQDVEFWLLDDKKEVNDALNVLAKSMDKASRNTLLEQAPSILYVMAYISSGKSLRMMSWFDEKHQNGLTVDLVDLAKKNPENTHARLLLDRLQTIKSLSLMNKVFAQSRTRLIIEILKGNE